LFGAEVRFGREFEIAEENSKDFEYQLILGEVVGEVSVFI
jgi:hypothetical protein